MNCFYAQVEQLCYNLYGIPVIVGAWRKGNGIPRGIVATASYEARKFNIKTGMSALEATKLCPYVVPLQVHYEKYQAISREIECVLDEFAKDIEGYSMDEYFMDISFMLGRPRSDLKSYCVRLKNELYKQTGLVCSLGVSYSKTYAKLASDLYKPNGMCLVLNKNEAREKLYPLALDEVWGIGSRRYAKLKASGLVTIQDAVNKGSRIFVKLFGKLFGEMLYLTVSGQDCARIMENKDHIPKEVSYMHTFSHWTIDLDRIIGEISKSISQLCYRMRGYQRKAEHFGAYIRFQDDAWNGAKILFSTDGLTNLDEPVLSVCLDHAIPLLKKCLDEGQRVRGIGVYTMNMDTGDQLQLFYKEDVRQGHLYTAIDKINNQFGQGTVTTASMKCFVEGKTHFLERNN